MQMYGISHAVINYIINSLLQNKILHKSLYIGLHEYTWVYSALM